MRSQLKNKRGKISSQRDLNCGPLKQNVVLPISYADPLMIQKLCCSETLFDFLHLAKRCFVNMHCNFTVHYNPLFIVNTRGEIHLSKNYTILEGSNWQLVEKTVIVVIFLITTTMIESQQLL